MKSFMRISSIEKGITGERNVARFQFKSTSGRIWDILSDTLGSPQLLTSTKRILTLVLEVGIGCWRRTDYTFWSIRPPLWRHQMEAFSTSLDFVWGIHRSPVNSPHNVQWRRVLMVSLIRAWTYSWENTRDAGNLGRHCVHYDVTVIILTDQCHHVAS